ncbi:MAG: cell wall hydrolase [Oscillospiraceae bacterium]
MKLNKKRTFLTVLSLISIVSILTSNLFLDNQTILSNENFSSMDYYNMYHNEGLNLTYDEYIMICSLIQGETAGAELHWSELVAGVVYNRLNSSEFPNTIYEILSQPNQFDELKNYHNSIDINSVTYQAVFNVFTGNAKNTMKDLNGAVYYCNPDILDNEIVAWFDENLIKTYDATYKSNGKVYHHVFYK